MRTLHAAQTRVIREAVDAVRAYARSGHFDGCDASDVEDVIASLEQALDRAAPNAQTLSSYLNSLLRSIRPRHHAAALCAQLEDAMKKADIALDSPH